MSEKKQVAARVDPKKHKQVRIAAAKKDLNMADWLREAIDEKLERESEADTGNSTAVLTAD